VCGARGSEVQRAEAAARHQGRSTPGGKKLGVPHTGGLSVFFYDTGGLSAFFLNTGGLYDFFGLSQIPGLYLIFFVHSKFRGFI